MAFSREATAGDDESHRHTGSGSWGHQWIQHLRYEVRFCKSGISVASKYCCSTYNIVLDNFFT